MATLLLCAAAAPAASFRLLGAGPTASRLPTHRVPALVAKEGGVDALKGKLARVSTVGLYGALLVVSGSDLLEQVPTLLDSAASGLTGGDVGLVGDVVLDGGIFVVAGLQLTVPPELRVRVRVGPPAHRPSGGRAIPPAAPRLPPAEHAVPHPEDPDAAR
eukprot:scaffold80048_cov57-Phaeocystis_antarctica.AAC.1